MGSASGVGSPTKLSPLRDALRATFSDSVPPLGLDAPYAVGSHVPRVSVGSPSRCFLLRSAFNVPVFETQPLTRGSPYSEIAADVTRC